MQWLRDHYSYVLGTGYALVAVDLLTGGWPPGEVLGGVGVVIWAATLIAMTDKYRREGKLWSHIKGVVDVLLFTALAWGIVLVFDVDAWWAQVLVFAAVMVAWYVCLGVVRGILRARAPEPVPTYPPLKPVMVSMDPARARWADLHDAPELIHVVGAVTREHYRRGGMCCEQPDEYVMDHGGFIVASPDPSVHPGSIAMCALPAGHDGPHTWQSGPQERRFETWPR